MTVGDNIKFGLKLRKMPADQQEEILNKYLKIIKLEKFRDSYPRELSGGMETEGCDRESTGKQPGGTAYG